LLLNTFDFFLITAAVVVVAVVDVDLFVPMPPCIIKPLSFFTHFEKPHDSQSLGLRSNILSNTNPPSIATKLPLESFKNLPILYSIV